MRQITLFFLALTFAFTALAQTKITGIISDNMDVLPEANIIIKGTEKGTASDLKGNFKLDAKPNDTLSISYLGYATKEVVVKQQKKINITLDIDNTLDEVEVIAFSSRRNCRLICCGITIFKSEDVSIGKQSTLYPNPSSTGFFNLKLLKNYKKVNIQVTNMSGQVVLLNSFQNVNKKVSLDLSEFTSGIYIINIIADDKKLPAKKAIVG
ncbi:carboxypeptidase-like regulatory domain-containing protein [Olleya sp. R77988]|uniref:T9SS type A sorting domain-containing protein n=1 Tax=Olleya sp. R77988 TaxID=3093875 RepID=UPI0037C90640